jgi:diadenosine tetraphosphatase ApaH/serine/threonine PP2A family protein phosphatase
MFQLDEAADRVSLKPIRAGEPVNLEPRLIANPGSVGQPRDRDPRSAYAIYDSTEKTWEPRRVAYNIPEVQKRIRDAKLPEKHAVRIAEGW